MIYFWKASTVFMAFRIFAASSAGSFSGSNAIHVNARLAPHANRFAKQPLEPVFDILLEGRLESLSPDTMRCNDVAQLSRESAFAEKFLANADRGPDASTLARDVIDMAYMAEHWGMQPARAGLRLAEAAYGDDVQSKLDHAIGKIQTDRLWRQQCERGLNLDRHNVFRAGLEKLQATRWRKAPAQHGKPG